RMQALPAALSLACGPSQESMCPPSSMNCSPALASSAEVIVSACQPLLAFARSQTRTGPSRQRCFSRSPSVRAIPTQGRSGISLASDSGEGLPQADLIEPNGTAWFDWSPQFIITWAIEPCRQAISAFSWRAGEYDSSDSVILPRTSLPAYSDSAPEPT